MSEAMTDRTEPTNAAKPDPAWHLVDCLPDWVTPNHLTFLRLALALIILIMDFQGMSLTWIVILGLIAGFSDLADGALARRRGQVTKLGTFLDPLGDKFFAVVLLLMVWRRGYIEPWVIGLILICELHAVVLPLIILLKRKMKGQKLSPSPRIEANRFGKLKTGWLASAMGLMLMGEWLGFPLVVRFAYYNVFVAIALGLIAEVLYFKGYVQGRYN